MTYEAVDTLLAHKETKKAEKMLNHMTSKDDYWYYLYSQVLMQKAWFDSAKTYLEKAIALNPTHTLYQKAYAQFMSRPNHYSDPYYNSPRYRRRSGCCCCCCDDDCCQISCCDLICADTCCECMGGDLISCI